MPVKLRIEEPEYKERDAEMMATEVVQKMKMSGRAV